MPRNLSTRSPLPPDRPGGCSDMASLAKVAKPAHRASGLTKETILDARQAAYLEQVKRRASTKAGLFERCYRGTASPRQVIKCRCIDCQGFDAGATEGIRDCAITSCPAWRYRPYQSQAARQGCCHVAA